MSRPTKSKVTLAFPDRVQITLTGEEAIVLLDFLARFNRDKNYRFEDQSEQRVFWDIECILEKEFSLGLGAEHYAKYLKTARAKVRDPKK